jgi:3'(2'), 5'-bisphosphate nucleotidase
MTRDDGDHDAIARQLAEIACEAGGLLRQLESRGVDHRINPNGTPTSAADLAAEDLILNRLERAFPGVALVAEETANAAEPEDRFFLIDPLDGTGDFLHGTGEYSVNIALVEGDRPVAGVVLAPALDRIWIAGTDALEGTVEGGRPGGWREARARPAPATRAVALVSRRHGDPTTEACLASLSIGTRRTASSALKFCLIASGEADVYVRCGPTMEWDTAAGDHILARAGGRVIGSGGEPLTYGHLDRGYLNGPFAALGDASLAPRLNLPSVAVHTPRTAPSAV